MDASVGDTLRRQREALGLSISEVANSLKLNARQVEALEAGRFEQLPGAAFVRGFLRNYARLLKIDPAPLLARVETPSVGATVELSPASNAQGDMPQVGRGRFRRSVIPGIAAALGLFGLVLAGWYYDNQRKQAASELIAEAQAPEPAPAPGPVAEPAGVPPAVAPTQDQDAAVTPPVAETSVPVAPVVQSADKPEKIDKAEKVDTAAGTPAAVGKDTLVFAFSEDAWVEVKDKNGKVVYSKLGKSGATETLEAAPPMSLVIGNARSVKLARNGQPVDLGLSAKMTVARLKLE